MHQFYPSHRSPFRTVYIPLKHRRLVFTVVVPVGAEMHFYADRVRETTTTSGTGTYDLAGAVAGYQSFVDGIGSNNSCYYCCTDDNDWEVGFGIVTSGVTPTLTRTRILASSNADSAVNWGSGTKAIFCTFPADQVLAEHVKWMPGAYIHGQEPDTEGSGISIVADRLYLCPLLVPIDCIIDGIFTYVNTTGTATSTRLGIYKPVQNDPDSWELVVDAGTINPGSTGTKEITGLAQRVQRGVHAVAILSNGTWTNLGAVTSGLKRPLLAGQSGSYNGGRIACLYKSYSFGTLPSTLSTMTVQLTNLPGSGVRVT